MLLTDFFEYLPRRTSAPLGYIIQALADGFVDIGTSGDIE
jgi:hypothetical protein